jgi:hypothetical protein
MIPKSRVVAVATIAAMNFSSPLNAGAEDYLFEAVKPEIKSSNVAVIAVRLLSKTIKEAGNRSGDRADMAPDGMAEMTAPFVPLPSPEAGIFAFKAPLTMAGHWLLTILRQGAGGAGNSNEAR